LIQDEETLAAIRQVQMRYAGTAALGVVKFKKKRKKDKPEIGVSHKTRIGESEETEEESEEGGLSRPMKY
jgi:hypothetical protein